MEQEYISMKKAAELLQVKRPSLYYYVKALKLETKRFELDRNIYLAMGDVTKIKELRDNAAKRQEEPRMED